MNSAISVTRPTKYIMTCVYLCEAYPLLVCLQDTVTQISLDVTVEIVSRRASNVMVNGTAQTAVMKRTVRDFNKYTCISLYM